MRYLALQPMLKYKLNLRKLINKDKYKTVY